MVQMVTCCIKAFQSFLKNQKALLLFKTFYIFYFLFFLQLSIRAYVFLSPLHGMEFGNKKLIYRSILICLDALAYSFNFH